MELYLISGYVALCIAIFAVLRIPLNRWTVPTASIGGAVLVFGFIQVLNFYHPYSGLSQQAGRSIPQTIAGPGSDISTSVNSHNLVAWFQQNSLPRLDHRSTVEVTFDSIPGQVFSAELGMVLPMPLEGQTRDNPLRQPSASGQPRIPVLINITDARYAEFALRLPAGAPASAAIYGEELQHLALVRKTLLRMSAWMNYLSVYV